MVEGEEWWRVEDGGGWRVRCLLEEHAAVRPVVSSGAGRGRRVVYHLLAVSYISRRFVYHLLAVSYISHGVVYESPCRISVTVSYLSHRVVYQSPCRRSVAVSYISRRVVYQPP